MAKIDHAEAELHQFITRLSYELGGGWAIEFAHYHDLSDYAAGHITMARLERCTAIRLWPVMDLGKKLERETKRFTKGE